jgi:hypothetical protein
MSTLDFLRAVLPPDGYACIVAIKGSHVQQTFHAMPSMATVRTAIQANLLTHNLFFGVNVFATPTSRAADNMYLSNSLFLDLDVGAGNDKYPTDADALAGLDLLCTANSFPTPTYTIHSGYGIHAYWVMAQALPRAEWLALANNFKLMCVHTRSTNKFVFDAKIPADAARIMRIPGTMNYKNPADPRAAHFISQGVTHQTAALQGALQRFSNNALPAAPRLPVGLDSTASLVGTYQPAYFQAILNKTKTGAGCAQLDNCVAQRAALPEPLWRAALSIANRCADRIEAIELVSKDYPDYDLARADHKAAATLGPHSCAEFNTITPGLCQYCPHYGRITSPITIGVVPAAVTANAPLAAAAILARDPVEYILRNEIPNATADGTLPYPYHRTTQGIYKELSDDEAAKAIVKGMQLVPSPTNPTGAANCVRVFDYDFAMTAVGYDADTNEEVYGLSVKMPRDPLRTQTMTSSALKAADKFRTALHMGAGIADYEITNLRDLVVRSVKHFRSHQRASDVVKQLGWTSRNTFCFGAYEIHENKTITTVLNRPEVRQLMSAVRVEGDVQTGIDAFRDVTAFWSRPNYEYGGIAMATTFAAPLLHVMGVISGGVIHCYSPLSGRGKSAIQMACLAAWGEYDKLIALPSDTDNSTMHHINMLGSLPMAIEEITKMSIEDTGNMIYQLTHGREKRRMDGATYTNKPTLGNYRTLTITSGNASILDKAMAGSTSPDGLLYRVMELRMDTALPVDFNMEELLQRLTRNHGAVGAIYIAWVVVNRLKVKDMVRARIAQMEAEWGIEKHERYWREIMTYMLIGMEIANSLGVANFDLPRLTAWLHEWYKTYKVRVVKMLTESRDVMAEIVARHVRDTVFILKSGIAVMHTGGAACMSYNHNTRELWITSATLSKAVLDLNMDISAVTTNMVSSSFAYVGSETMAAGSTLLTGMTVTVGAEGHKYIVHDHARLPDRFAEGMESMDDMQVLPATPAR